MSDIKFELHDPLHIRIDTDHYDYLKDIDNLLTEYVKNYQFQPKYKAGFWSGKISLFKRQTKTFPYGLLLKILKHTKTDWPELEYNISPDIKNLFTGIEYSPKYNLTLEPYDYQQETIHQVLTRSKGLCQLPTASGKSFVITCSIEKINEYISNEQSLIIVPTLQLIDQFKGDMIEYGIDEDRIGCVNSDFKEFDKNIVIATWQSMQNQLDQMERFYSVFIDEVHGAKADKLLELLQNCPQARFRIGMTGTMPTDPLEYMNVQSYLGPVLIKYTGKDLANMGYISHCIVKPIKIFYEDDLNEKRFDYTYVRDTVFTNPYRMGLIKKLVQKTNNSVLILVEKVEKEGEVLEEELKQAFPDKNVVFLSGRNKAKDRDTARKIMDKTDNMVIVSTYPIFQQGVNVKSLRTIILASSTKSYVRVIQSLGRSLRKHVSKEKGGAELYDLCDQTKYLRDHGNKRERHYIKEGHEIEELVVEERSGNYAGI